MKVLQIHNTYRFKGGEDTVVANELSLLKNAGISVETLYFTNDELSNTSIFYSQTSVRRLREIITSFKPNIIHVHNLFYSASPSILIEAKKQGIPVVMTLHNYRLICPNAMFLRDGKICTKCKNKKFANPAIAHKCFKDSHAKTTMLATSLYAHNILGTWRKNVDKFIVLTPFAKKMFANSALNLEADKFIIKPNSTDDINASLKTTRNGYLFVGRLSKEKGVKTLIEAFNRLPELHLDIMGTGELEAELKALAKKNIRFLGNVSHDQLKTKIANYKALVFTSIVFEGLPNTIIEAFASATPVIASNIDNINSIVTNDHDGKLFQVDNPESLEKTIRTFEVESHQGFNKNAKNTFLENYTHKVNLQSLLVIYQDLVKD